MTESRLEQLNAINNDMHVLNRLVNDLELISDIKGNYLGAISLAPADFKNPDTLVFLVTELKKIASIRLETLTKMFEEG